MRNWFRRTDKVQPAPKRRDSARFKQLPGHVNLRDTRASQPATPARDTDGSRDTERDFIIRYGDPFDE
jgi:hypothetical protein